MLTALALYATLKTTSADTLADQFTNPPLSARPQTWWHWMNGMVTKEGITADLEAMKEVGIGGTEAFTVDQGIPAGPAKYAGPVWREMTNWAIKESARLGLQFCIHNGAGWSSSGGPWITPENAMQVIAWSTKRVQGPAHFDEQLPKASAPRVDSEVPYYRDIAVFAYPTPPAGDVVKPRPADFLAKTGVERGDGLQVDLTPLTEDIVIPSSKVIQLTSKLAADGKLSWDVPAGDWTILRMGHVPTGVHNHPAPPEGDGLEVDKLSRAALQTHWDALVAKVISDAGPLVPKTFNDVLIDSYEVGTQNWSPKFREDFKKRRGYDPLPYLPVIAGRIIDSKEKSERFLWDLRKTIADLYADNYYGGLADLCHKYGMMFSTEPYGNGGFDTMDSGARADIPMAEFWLGGGAMETTKMVSSIGHIYGHPVIGAESFTGDVMPGRWREEPYAMKALGDRAFCNGINRYIFHRYAMQPWLNLNPGMTMGPWGTHLERTQTWWTEAASWMKYIARCQYLLQAGTFRADACYFYGENSPLDLPYGGALKPVLPAGYDYDGCDANTLLKMSVRDGKVTLPSGMSYSLLILPQSTFMTPAVARKVRDLVAAGAAVYGAKPTQSPSLNGYPACDSEVKSIADSVWGDDAATTKHKYGEGAVYWGSSPEAALRDRSLSPDFRFTGSSKLLDIHRRIGDADVYFVSNQANRPAEELCSFRVRGKKPELWNPETGYREDAPVYRSQGDTTQVALKFTPAQSWFVIFRKPDTGKHLVSFSKTSADGTAIKAPEIVIQSAHYGSEDGRGADVTSKVQDMVRSGDYEIDATNSNFGDTVVNVVKRLVINYTVDGKPRKVTVAENESAELADPSKVEQAATAYELRTLENGDAELVAWQPGGFEYETDHTRTIKVDQAPLSLSLDTDWNVSFPPNLGAPAGAHFNNLTSWTESEDPGVKYFSGSATYTKTFTMPASFLAGNRVVRLDLGLVKNFATIKLNGRTVRVLWKPPFAADVTPFLQAGENRLEIKVTNLWPNRIIGDEQLPPDVEWDGDHLKKWPDWLINHQPRPNTGRVTFETWKFYSKDSPLLESGMLGPVTLQSAERIVVKL